MKLTDRQIQFMQEDLSRELVEILVEEKGCDVIEAMEILYNSETYARLSNPATGLYYQSAGYVYDFLTEELSSAKLRA